MENKKQFERTTKSGKKIIVTRKLKNTVFAKDAKTFTKKTKNGKTVTVNQKARTGVQKPVKNTSGVVTYQRRTKSGKMITVTRRNKPKKVV